jgi:hypothetical protein
MHKLIVVALASSAFGGVIGALATAATQSQASPQAIVAAAQRVSDSSADRSLTAISSQLRSLTAIDSQLQTITASLTGNGRVAGMLKTICDVEVNAAPFPNTYFCPALTFPARDRR